MATQPEMCARPAFVFITYIAPAYVARQHEHFNRSMEGPSFAPGHGCTSRTPQCQRKRFYARWQQQLPN